MSELFVSMFLVILWVKLHIHLAHRYYANTETYLRAVALKRMPPNLQTVDMLKAGEISYSLYFYVTGCLYVSSVLDDPCPKNCH